MPKIAPLMLLLLVSLTYGQDVTAVGETQDMVELQTQIPIEGQ